ncbi:MAG: hypothetical protein EOP09_13285, partial [Proteobacteria bacterium]
MRVRFFTLSQVQTGSDGVYTLYVFAKDEAGNISSPSTASIDFDGTQPILSLLTLTGGQLLKGGVGQSINWSVTDAHLAAAPISIDVSSNSGGTWASIAGATNIANTGTFSWSVPSVNSATYRIRISALDSYGNSSTAISNSNLTIDSLAPVVTLTSLTGGQVLTAGVSQSITWTATDLNLGLSPVNLEVSTDSGSSWAAITGGSAIANSGSFAWSAPATAGTHYRIRVGVTDAVANVAYATSASDFEIQNATGAPVATLNSPATTNSFAATLTTASCSAGGTWAKILVTESTSTPLASDAAWVNCSTTAGAYALTLGGTGSRSIRVYGKTGGGVVSSSYASLTVVVDQTNPAVSLTSLTGGGIYAGGSSQTLTWTASDTHLSGTPIRLEVSANSGSTWTTITGASALSNSGTFTYVLPAQNASTFRVRVTATDDAGNSATAASTSDFSIDSTAPTVAFSSTTSSITNVT